MKSSVFTILLCFLSLALSAQTPSNLRGEFELKGKVVTEVRETPIPGISVSTDQGAYTLTNQFGEFEIMAAAGDMLIVSDPEMETVRYRIRNNEDIKILVRDIEPETLNRAAEPQLSKTEQHRQLLDSALHYKQLDIERSLAFVTRSIELLDGRSNARELAASLTTLGEIYQFHQQYDLAISNYREALEQFDSSRTLLLLGKTYVLNEQFQEALDLLLPEADRSGLIPFQRLELYEILGDAYGGLEQVNTAVSLYQRALTVAEKNQLVAKVPVLNSKIAMAYDNAERPVEAEAYFSNSLEEAKTQNPSLAVLESENLADFFQKRSRFQEEITQRKESLEKLKAIGATVILPEADSITVQGINYKIGAAYLAQSRSRRRYPIYLKVFGRPVPRATW